MMLCKIENGKQEEPQQTNTDELGSLVATKSSEPSKISGKKALYCSRGDFKVHVGEH